jgi:hypothetical protein
MLANYVHTVALYLYECINILRLQFLGFFQSANYAPPQIRGYYTVCLFIAAQAIFQLSGGCHHYR